MCSPHVANLLVIGRYGHGFAFNLADVFFTGEILPLMSALIAMTVVAIAGALPRPGARAFH